MLVVRMASLSLRMIYIYLLIYFIYHNQPYETVGIRDWYYYALQRLR